MKRTRKWQFVRQEAQRLADLRLSPKEIAERLGVNRSSVQRWMAEGKLRETRANQGVTVPITGEPSGKGPQTPEEWAKDVRATYQLDATDEQLVTVAEEMLTTARDGSRKITERINAVTRFQSIVKQLALPARTADADPAQPVAPEPEKEKKPALRVVRRGGKDPRRALLAVNE